MYKEEFGEKLHFGEITSIICVPIREQVWALGVKRLLTLNVKLYNSYK